MGFIYGDELFEFCKDQISELKSVSDSPFQCGQVEAFLDVMKKINSMPEATRIVPSGHWIYKKFDITTGIANSYFCSECGNPQSQTCLDFCAACGADMREVQYEED